MGGGEGKREGKANEAKRSGRFVQESVTYSAVAKLDTKIVSVGRLGQSNCAPVCKGESCWCQAQARVAGRGLRGG